MTFSRLWQQHNCRVLHELPRHCSWSPAKYKPSQSLTVVNKAWQFVWSLWKCSPHPLHRVHMLSQAHRRMFSIGGLSLLFYWLCCRIIGSGDESGHAGLQGCSPVTAAQRIPAWCFPGRRHNGGCVPADTQHKRWTVRKPPPKTSIPVVILFKVSSECYTQHRRVFLTSHVMCADTWGAAAQLTD